MIMTRGQYRRRYQSRVRTALFALPTWIVFAGILFNGGLPIFKDGLPALGDCADCCPGTTNPDCNDCPATDAACVFCGAETPNNTPAQWHVTYMSVTLAMPCTNCGDYFTSGHFGTHDDIYLHSFGFLGTYTLSDRIFTACDWSRSSGTIPGDSNTGTCSGFGTPTGAAGCGNAYYSYGNSAACDNPPGTFYFAGTDLTILSKTAGAISITAFAQDVGVGLSGTFFQGTLPTADDSCCKDYLFTNTNTAYACPSHIAFPGAANDGVFGINGFASVSVC